MGVDAEYPIRLKAAPEYTTPDPDSKGGPKYGHYATLDPVFAASKDAADKIVASLWHADTWETFRNNWKTPPVLPADCPQPEQDVVESYRKIPMRDGAEIEVKVMKSVHNNAEDNVCVLRMHGGGWAIGWYGTEAVENLHAAANRHVVLVGIDYRLAPEHQFPVPLNDCVDTLKWVKANATTLGINPEKIVLFGSSAGSNLALCTALRARDEGITGIIGMVLDWPVGAHPLFFPQLRKEGYELESYVQNSDATVVTPVIMEFFWRAYTPKVEADPYHSPLIAETFKGLPPALVQVGGYDPLRDEGIGLGEKLKKDGVPTDLHVYQGLPHCFNVLLPDAPVSKLFQSRQNAFLEKLIKKTK